MGANTRFVLTPGAAGGTAPEIASAKIASGASAPTAVLATAVSIARTTVSHVLSVLGPRPGRQPASSSRRAPRHQLGRDAHLRPSPNSKPGSLKVVDALRGTGQRAGGDCIYVAAHPHAAADVSLDGNAHSPPEKLVEPLQNPG